MDYLEKYQKNPFEDLYWNLPSETAKGSFAIIGGNANSFLTPVRVAESAAKFANFSDLKTVLPDSLKPKLPNFDNVIFLSTTDTGSFRDENELKTAIDAVDSTLIVGDVSKNSVTTKALVSALHFSAKPLLITRDAVDLIAADAEKLLLRDNFTIMGSIIQWQKIFRAVYYPKMLMPSQSLIQIAEAFHKFTLSYPVQIVTFHDAQILIAKNGRVAVVPLEKSPYTVLTLWNGELAAKIAITNLFNPDRFLESAVAAIFHH